MSDWKKKAERLEKECGWAKPIAVAFAWAGGRCEYCGCDLLHDRLGYAVGELDHLLPKSKYKDLANCSDNWVLSCKLCNTIKHTLDVARETSRHGCQVARQASGNIHNRGSEVHLLETRRGSRCPLDASSMDHGRQKLGVTRIAQFLDCSLDHG